MISNELGKLGYEALTERQRAFADFIAARVKPTEKTTSDSRDNHEVNLSIDPSGQLVPIVRAELEMYERIPTETELAELEEGQPVPEPYTVWGVRMNNDAFGIDTALYLTAHEGFTYKGSETGFLIAQSDEFGNRILDSLIAAEDAGLITPA